MSDTESNQAIIAAVLEAEGERLAAIHASDWSKLADRLGDDLTYTHMSGLFQNKAENIVDMKMGPRSYKREDLVVRPLGDIAVMNGMIEVTMFPRPDGTPARLLYGRVVQVWAYRGGRWQMIVFQATAVPTEAK